MITERIYQGEKKIQATIIGATSAHSSSSIIAADYFTLLSSPEEWIRKVGFITFPVFPEMSISGISVLTFLYSLTPDIESGTLNKSYNFEN